LLSFLLHIFERQICTDGSFHVKWTNEKTRPSPILFILGRL
jgi:hypothetical protein